MARYGSLSVFLTGRSRVTVTWVNSLKSAVFLPGGLATVGDSVRRKNKLWAASSPPERSKDSPLKCACKVGDFAPAICSEQVMRCDPLA